jgi:hypothetical protein
MNSLSRWLIGGGVVALTAGFFRGCEFADAEDWTEGGEARVPKSHALDLDVTTLTAGHGNQVRAGDIVEVDVRELPEVAPGTDVPKDLPPVHGTAWVWIGDLTAAKTTFPPTSRLTTGRIPRGSPNFGIGPADFRKALAGIPVGSTLSIAIALRTRRTPDRVMMGLPRNGILFDGDYYSAFVDPLGTSSTNAPLRFGHRYEVTLRRACPARLLIRNVSLTQLGPYTECMGLRCGLTLSRSARLQLGLIDGRCSDGELLHFGPIAAVDKDATEHPRAFEDTIKSRIQQLTQRWPTFSHTTY